MSFSSYERCLLRLIGRRRRGRRDQYPRIVDLLVSENRMQELMLSDYIPISNGSVFDLLDSDFAQITPMGNK